MKYFTQLFREHDHLVVSMPDCQPREWGFKSSPEQNIVTRVPLHLFPYLTQL